MSIRVVVVNNGDEAGVSRLAMDGIVRAGIGRVGVGEEI